MSDYSMIKIVLNIISLAFLADDSLLIRYREFIAALGEDDINDSKYSSLKDGLMRLQIFENVLSVMMIIVIFFYIIILLNFVIAVMGDT